jgi:hypothetical protein
MIVESRSDKAGIICNLFNCDFFYRHLDGKPLETVCQSLLYALFGFHFHLSATTCYVKSTTRKETSGAVLYDYMTGKISC